MKSKKIVSVLCATMSSLLLFGGNGSSLSAPGKFAVAILCAGGILGSKCLVDLCYDDDDDEYVNEPLYLVGEFWEILEDKKRLFGLLSDLKSTQARCYDDYCPIDSPLVVDSNYLRTCSEEVRRNYEGPYRFQYRNFTY